MGETFQIEWPEHNSYVCEEMWRLFNSGDGLRNGPSHLEISCHDAEPFAAHYIILRIFCQHLVDSNSRQIAFADPEIEKDDVRCLVEFMYLGKTCVEKKRLKVIHRAAEQLGLMNFVSALSEDLENRVTEIEEENVSTLEETNAENAERRTCEKTEVDGNFQVLLEALQENSSSNKTLKQSEENDKSDLERKRCEKADNEGTLEISPEVVEEDLFPNKKLKKSEEISTDSSESKENNSQTSKGEIKSSWKVRESGSILDGVFDKDVSCPFCCTMFKDKSRYTQHLKSHTKPGSFKCPHCSYRGKLLEKHMSVAHQLDKDGKPLKKLFACNICNFKCFDQVQLKGHALQKHGTREFKCTHCNYLCYTSWRLERHLKHMHFVTSDCSNGASKVIPAASKVIPSNTSQMIPRISVVAPGISVVNSGISRVTNVTPKISVVAPGISVVSSKIAKVTPVTLEESPGDSSKISNVVPETSKVSMTTPEMTEEQLEERSTGLEESSQVVKDVAEIIEADSVVVEQVIQVIKMDSGGVEVSSEIVEVVAAGLEENAILDPRPFKCDVCGEGYKTAAYLKSHAEIHLGKVVCEICGESLAFKSLQKHKKMVHREDTVIKSFQCHLCSLAFTANEYLKSHLRKVHTERRFKCEKCGALFKTPWGVTSHSEVHLERINCGVCGKSLTQRSHRSHMNLIHGVDLKAKNSPSKTTPKEVFKCSVCPFNSRVRSLLQRHVRDIHPENRNYACQVCGMRFKNKKGLDCHSSVHRERVACTFCGKSLSARCVPSHMKIVHAGKKLSRPMNIIAKCPLNNCDFKSNYRSNLKKHLKKRHRLGDEELEAVWGKVADEFTINGVVQDGDCEQ